MNERTRFLFITGLGWVMGFAACEVAKHYHMPQWPTFALCVACVLWGAMVTRIYWRGSDGL